MAKNIFFHVYSSVAVKELNPPELLELLNHSRDSNAKLGLSGMLLYKNGNFMQVLEGPEQAVRPLLEKIRKDPRHHMIQQIMEGNYPERQFPYWYMGFCNLDTAEGRKTPGYSEFLNTPLNVGLAADPTLCQKLLHLFKDRNQEKPG